MQPTPPTIEALRQAVKDAKRAIDQWEPDTDSKEMSDAYDAMLDDCNPVIVICGMRYCPSRVLAEVDPTAYRCGLVDWADSLDKEDSPEYQVLAEALEEAEQALADAEEAQEAQS